jgi:hypothetical protein
MDNEAIIAIADEIIADVENLEVLNERRVQILGY